jgi:hypothetical protein
VAALAGAALIAYSCAPADDPLRPDGPAASLRAPLETAAGAPLPPMHRFSVDDQLALAHLPGTGAGGEAARARQALRKAEWVGDLHNRALHEGMQQARGFSRVPRIRDQQACVAVTEIARKYLPEIETHSGLTFSAAERARLIRNAVSATGECATGGPLSIFNPEPAVLVVPSLAEPVVTGAFVPYANELEWRADMGDGSRSSVNSAVYSTMVSAAGIEAPDYEVLGAIGSLAMASADYWNTLEDLGYLDDVAVPLMVTQTFRRRAWFFFKIDLISCSGAAAGYAATPGAVLTPQMVAVYCTIFGLTSSTVAGMKM